MLQLPGDALGGALFPVGQLGVLVQIPVEGLLGGLEAVVAGQDILDAAHGHRPFALGCVARTLPSAGVSRSVNCNQAAMGRAGRLGPVTALAAARGLGRPAVGLRGKLARRSRDGLARRGRRPGTWQAQGGFA